MSPPCAAFGVTPQGAPSAARQSRFREGLASGATASDHRKGIWKLIYLSVNFRGD